VVAATTSDAVLPNTGGTVLSVLRKPSVLPGFGLTLGFTLTYLSLIVLLPLAALALKAAGLGWSGFWDAVLTPRVLAAFKVSFGLSLAAAAVNAVFGFIVAGSSTRWWTCPSPCPPRWPASRSARSTRPTAGSAPC